MAAASIAVRPYEPSDAAGVRRLYADTAFFGEPVERYFDDRGLFAALGVEPYLRAYPQHIRVAVCETAVVGYVLGCPSGDSAMRRVSMSMFPEILAGFRTGRYRPGRRAAAYTLRLLLATTRRQLLEINSEAYPANLHINIDASCRRRGLGQALMHSYLEGLRRAGIGGVHLVTTSENVAALRLFSRFGFRMLACKRSRLWRPYLGHDISLLALGLRLAPSPGPDPA